MRRYKHMLLHGFTNTTLTQIATETLSSLSITNWSQSDSIVDSVVSRPVELVRVTTHNITPKWKQLDKNTLRQNN